VTDSPTPHLRPATPADAEAIAAIYNQTVAAGDASMDESPRSAEDFRRRLEHLAPREGFWVLEVAGDVRGWSSLKLYSDRAGYRFTAESTVYLRREHRGRGYGRLLGEALLQSARERDFHHLVAKVMADNAGSIAYHESLGYELVGRQREVGYRDGRWVDVVILERLLR
jgi:phosphinothricin acetyltransferase